MQDSCCPASPLAGLLPYGIAARDMALHNAHTFLARKAPDSAYQFVLNAIRIYELGQNDSLLYFARMLNGFILQEKQLNIQTLREYKAVSRIGERLGMPLLSAVYADIGLAYFQLGNHDSSYFWYRKAEQHKDFAALLPLQRNVFNNMAIYYLYQRNYPLATSYHKKSLAIRKLLKDTTGIAESYLNLGDLYFDQYKDKQAAYYWRKSLTLALQLKDMRLLELAYYNLSQVMQAGRRYKKALAYYQHSVAWKDSLWNRDKVWTLGETQKQLAVKEKQSRIISLEKDMTLQQQETIAKRKERNALLAISLLLCLVVVMVAALYRQQIRTARILKAQHRQLDQLNQTKDRLFSIMAHDMRTPLSGLYDKSNQLAEETAIQCNDRLQALVADTRLGITAFHGLLDNLLYWSFSETGNLLLQVQSLPVASLIKQAAAHLDLQLKHKQIRLCYTDPARAFVLADSYTLKMIFRNLIQNAIKFSFCGQLIDIGIRDEDGNCYITIRDRGTGIAEELFPYLFSFNREKQRRGTTGESGSGLGLWLCQDFIQKNKGSLELNNHPGGGTVACVRLPSANL